MLTYRLYRGDETALELSSRWNLSERRIFVSFLVNSSINLGSERASYFSTHQISSRINTNRFSVYTYDASTFRNENIKKLLSPYRVSISLEIRKAAFVVFEKEKRTIIRTIKCQVEAPSSKPVPLADPCLRSMMHDCRLLPSNAVVFHSGANVY